MRKKFQRKVARETNCTCLAYSEEDIFTNCLCVATFNEFVGNTCVGEKFHGSADRPKLSRRKILFLWFWPYAYWWYHELWNHAMPVKPSWNQRHSKPSAAVLERVEKLVVCSLKIVVADQKLRLWAVNGCSHLRQTDDQTSHLAEYLLTSPI